MSTLRDNIIQIKNIFEAIANAIRSKLGEDAIDKCDGPDTYVEKILLIGTGSSDCPECPECPDIPNIPKVTILTNGPLTIEKEGNILVQYKNYDSIKDPIFTEDWLTITSSQEDVHNYIVNCEPNESGNDRTVDITFSCTKENLTAFNKISIIQPFYEVVTKTSVTCDETLYISSSEELEEWKTINVTYIDPNEIFDPECNYNSLDNWFDWKRFSDGHYAVDVMSNESDETREGTITFSCSDTLGNKYSATCKIIQESTEKGPSIVISPTEWKNISADGDTKTFAVTTANALNESGYYYHIDSYPDWISFTMASSSFTVTAEANSTEESRSGKIQVSCTGTNGTTIYKMIDVEQLDKESEELYLNVSVENNTISYEGGNVIFTIDTNSAYDINSPSDYCKVEAEEPTRAIINVYKNESVDSRELTFIFTCSEDSGISKTIKITQTGNELPVSISVTPESYTFPAEFSQKEFIVTVTNGIPVSVYNSRFDPETYPAWISLSYDGSNSCYIRAEENTSTEQRSGEVVFLAKGNGENNEARFTVTVTQLGQTVIDPTPQSSPMYYGYIPYVENESPWSYSDITEEYIEKCITDGTIKEMVAQEMNKTDAGEIPANSMWFIALPSATGLVAKQDDGDDLAVDFNNQDGIHSNGEVTITINNVEYKLYGHWTNIKYSSGSKFYYITK